MSWLVLVGSCWIVESQFHVSKRLKKWRWNKINSCPWVKESSWYHRKCSLFFSSTYRLVKICQRIEFPKSEAEVGSWSWQFWHVFMEKIGKRSCGISFGEISTKFGISKSTPEQFRCCWETLPETYLIEKLGRIEFPFSNEVRYELLPFLCIMSFSTSNRIPQLISWVMDFRQSNKKQEKGLISER